MANYLPATYQQTYGYSAAGPYMGYPAQNGGMAGVNPGMPQMSYGNAVRSTQGMKWVDGEAEAKGTPIPAGETQYAMWDINEPVIYIKSLNQMGMPNPMQKAHYQIEGMNQRSGAVGVNGSGVGSVGGSGGGVSGGCSGADAAVDPAEMTRYVKHEDLERMRKELMEAISGISAGNGGETGSVPVSGTISGPVSGTARRSAKGEAA